MYLIVLETSLASTLTLPILIVGGLGAIFGLVLAFASKVFHVEVDPRVTEITNALPGANCGACGMPGCAGYADAIVHNGELINKCAPGGSDAVFAIAKIMGVEASTSVRKVAVIHCSSGGYENTKWRYSYEGVSSCKAAVNIAGGPNKCNFGCMAQNDCMNACMFDAISLDENGIRQINYDKCTGCGACAVACPRQLIMLIPIDHSVYIKCSSKDKGNIAKSVCGNNQPCIGCGICSRNCPVNAITITDNLARIDYDVCINCGICATKCPTHAIQDLLAGKRKKAEINPDKCVGCHICAKNCPVDAIAGELKEKHVVDKDKCVGCEICFQKCPKKAIEMK
ncbi:MAG: RnfABCDGE type electron transport complex subunit B [Candidatus Cloacimonadota bacterium]